MLNNHIINYTEIPTQNNKKIIIEALKKASKKIAPLWPLENFVAVNPYLGLTNQTFEYTAQQLSNLAGIQSTLPVSYYLEAIEQGKMTLNDINEVLKNKKEFSKLDAKSFLQQINISKTENTTGKIAVVSDIATEVSGANWTDFMVNRMSTWAASFFDKGQAQWKATKPEQDLFNSWKFEAEIDRSPAVMGLSGFRQTIKKLPTNAQDATQLALGEMGIPLNSLDLYLHALLLRLGGWASYISQLDWEARMYEEEKNLLSEFLCVLICWEYGLYQCMTDSSFQEKWSANKNKITQLSSSHNIDKEIQNKVILQDAYDLATQRALIQKFNNKKKPEFTQNTIPEVQAIFCIDVRSEVYRRNLESVAPEIDTLGFAGFFGFPIKYVKMGHKSGRNHCPVLIPSAFTVMEEMPDKKKHESALRKRKLDNLFTYSWKSFKSSAVSSFGFVSPVGLSYLPKLFTDSFGLTRPVPHPDKKGLNLKQVSDKDISLEPNYNQTIGIPMEDRIKMAKGALQAMSLTDNFARLVLIVGHGSTSVNNPHATGLDCGACAGQSGEANAKVAAAILNDNSVRDALCKDEIIIPNTTHFIACLHDTTTDEVALFNTKEIPSTHQKDYENLKIRLSSAGKNTRLERALRMNLGSSDNVDLAIESRTKDWAQVRPEWGLAGCSTFVVAPRSLTKSINLEGQSFLHSYQWKKDKGFKVLEAIMTAPMVVTSWINLQYYGSTVDNMHFGSGNKTLHNVTAGIGVLEGYAGDLRTGLPMQSLHDGDKYQHEPKRLSVVINAPKEAITKVLEMHESVRDLCNNQWIFLMAMNDDGEITDVYDGDFMWRKLNMGKKIKEQSEKLMEEMA